jgi:hypothetical protein
MVYPFSWQNRVDAAVEAAEAARPDPAGNPKVMVTFRSDAAGLIRQAAAQRGVSVSGLARRATLAMAAQILGIPYAEAIATDPTIQLAGGYSPADDPAGTVGGPWEITGLRDGSERP